MYKNQRSPLSDKEKYKGEVKREGIRERAALFKRLTANPDFNEYLEILKKDKEGLSNNLLDERYAIKDRDVRTRLIARIDQIDSILKMPAAAEWRLKHLTEVREAIAAEKINPRAAGAR